MWNRDKAEGQNELLPLSPALQSLWLFHFLEDHPLFDPAQYSCSSCKNQALLFCWLPLHTPLSLHGNHCFQRNKQLLSIGSLIGPRVTLPSILHIIHLSSDPQIDVHGDKGIFQQDKIKAKENFMSCWKSRVTQMGIFPRKELLQSTLLEYSSISRVFYSCKVVSWNDLYSLPLIQTAGGNQHDITLFSRALLTDAKCLYRLFKKTAFWAEVPFADAHLSCRL